VIPDLGKYAGAVLGAYGVSIALLVGLCWLSWRQSVAARKALAAIERSADG
jgi:heme exporter protein D